MEEFFPRGIQILNLEIDVCVGGLLACYSEEGDAAERRMMYSTAGDLEQAAVSETDSRCSIMSDHARRSLGVALSRSFSPPRRLLKKDFIVDLV
jgi:hypothetical protein